MKMQNQGWEGQTWSNIVIEKVILIAVVWKRLREWRQDDPLKNSGSMPDEGWVHGFINQGISKGIQIFTVCYLFFFFKPLLQRDLSHIVWTDYFNVYWLPYLCHKPWGSNRSAPLMSSMKSVTLFHCPQPPYASRSWPLGSQLWID